MVSYEETVRCARDVETPVRLELARPLHFIESMEEPVQAFTDSLGLESGDDGKLPKK